MPNALGLYSLSEIQDKVRRLVWGEYIGVDPSTGDEIADSTIYDQIISNQDLADQINRQINLLYLEANMLSQDSQISTKYLSVNAYQPSVALPPDMLTLKEMHWKDPNKSNPMPQDWYPMYHLDQSYPAQFGATRAPSWHRDGNAIVFDSQVTQSNPGGIRVRYVQWVRMLVNAGDTLSGQLARVMQEAVIFGTANFVAGTKRGVVSQAVQDGYKTWHDALILAASNTERPEDMQMFNKGLVRRGFSGRFGRRRFRRA